MGLEFGLQAWGVSKTGQAPIQQGLHVTSNW